MGFKSKVQKGSWLTGGNGAVRGNRFIHSCQAIWCTDKEPKSENSEKLILHALLKINQYWVYIRAFFELFQGLGGGWFSGKTVNVLWFLLKIQQWIDSLFEHRDKVCPEGAFLTVGNPITLLTGPWKFENDGRQNCLSDTILWWHHKLWSKVSHIWDLEK